jgi:hypothetical protein
MWNCPKCSSDNLDVAITTWAKLRQGPGDEFCTDPTGSKRGDQEWNEMSAMLCRDCGNECTVSAFAAKAIAMVKKEIKRLRRKQIEDLLPAACFDEYSKDELRKRLLDAVIVGIVDRKDLTRETE